MFIVDESTVQLLASSNEATSTQQRSLSCRDPLCTISSVMHRRYDREHTIVDGIEIERVAVEYDCNGHCSCLERVDRPFAYAVAQR